MADWQPIETAPRETDVLVFISGRPFGANPFVVAGLFDNGEEEGWSSDLQEMEWLEGKPTHWMPLPMKPDQSA